MFVTPDPQTHIAVSMPEHTAAEHTAGGNGAGAEAGAGAGASDAGGAGGGVLPLAALAAAVDDLVAADPGAVDDHELAAAVVVLRGVQDRLAAASVELTAAFDARRVHASDGSRSAADWIATRSRHPKREVAGEVRLGRRLRAMPETRAAWRAGEIGVAHARSLARLAGNPRTAAAFAAGEPLLVDNARTMRFDDFERTCDHWRDAADPDGPEQRRGRDHALRRVDLFPGLDGVGLLEGYLTATARAVVGGALERIERELYTADRAAARGAGAGDGDGGAAGDGDGGADGGGVGSGVGGGVLARTGAQRRHDALVEMAMRAMTAPAGGARPQPLVTVLVGYETFAGRVCELAGGTVIAPGTVADLLGDDATLIERVVFDGPNRITDISQARSFRGVLRRVLEVKHPRCTHRTCDVPAHRCQGDHIVAWSRGGLTTQDNGQLLCGPHNRWRHHHPDPGPDTPTRAPASAPTGAATRAATDAATGAATRAPTGAPGTTGDPHRTRHQDPRPPPPPTGPP